MFSQFAGAKFSWLERCLVLPTVTADSLPCSTKSGINTYKRMLLAGVSPVHQLNPYNGLANFPVSHPGVRNQRLQSS